MSEQQKREVADELMMQPSAFGILVIAAALLIVAFVCLMPEAMLEYFATAQGSSWGWR